MKAQRRVNMIDSDRRRFQKLGVSRSSEVVERCSQTPGVGKVDNRENISSAIIVSLNNNDINLKSLCNVLRDVTFSGKVVEAFKRRSSSYQLSGQSCCHKGKGQWNQPR